MKKIINREQEKFFNQIAKQYDEKSGAYLESQEFFRKQSSPYIKGIVLDIGNGGMIAFDLEKAKRVILADIAVDMFKHLKRVHNGEYKQVETDTITCIKSDVRKMPFGNNYFDVVVMVTTAHHLSEGSLKNTRENIHQAFFEIHRVLKDKGTFLLLEVHPFILFKVMQDIFFELAYRMFMLIDKPLPYFMSKKETRNYLKTMGFHIQKEVIIPTGKKAYVPLFPFLSPPGWLWDKLLSSVLFISKKG